jgi:hypothetical protein
VFGDAARHDASSMLRDSAAETSRQ